MKMRLTANGVTKDISLYGLAVEHNGHRHCYIGNSMRGVVEPVSYSLSYDPKYQYCQRGGKIPASTKALAKALSSTGSYWSNSNCYYSMDAAEIKQAVSSLNEENISELVMQKDSYVSC